MLEIIFSISLLIALLLVAGAFSLRLEDFDCMFSKHDILKGVRGTVANSLQYVVFDIKGLES